MNVRKDGTPLLPEDEDIFITNWLTDPLERENLIGDPELAGTVAALRSAVLNLAATGIEPSFIPSYSAEERGVN